MFAISINTSEMKRGISWIQVPKGQQSEWSFTLLHLHRFVFVTRHGGPEIRYLDIIDYGTNKFVESLGHGIDK